MPPNPKGPYLLNLYKKPGPSSLDLVKKVRRLLPRKGVKSGHIGTLDPFADGVLLVGLGSGTRFSDYIHSRFPKIYKGIGIFGGQSTTGDFTGEITPFPVQKKYSQQEWKTKAQRFEGEYWQRPPYYSAVKFDGQPLYKWARAGKFIDRPKVLRQVEYFKILSVDGPHVSFEASVSSGTYIRALFEDLCTSMKTHGYLKSLTREAIGPFKREDSCRIEDLEENNLWEKVLRADQLIGDGKAFLNSEQRKRFCNGGEIQTIGLKISHKEGLIWAYEEKDLLGLAKIDGQNLRPVLVFC